MLLRRWMRVVTLAEVDQITHREARTSVAGAERCRSRAFTPDRVCRLNKKKENSDERSAANYMTFIH